MSLNVQIDVQIDVQFTRRVFTNYHTSCIFRMLFVASAVVCTSPFMASMREHMQVLTPEEFVIAGDHLVSTVGSWSWYSLICF